MLPRKQIRDAWHLLNLNMPTPAPTSINKGRLSRYHEADLPGVNITTFEDVAEQEGRTHGGCGDINYGQSVVIELYCPTKIDPANPVELYEDYIDELEEEFWTNSGIPNIPNVYIQYTGSSTTVIKDAETPQFVRLLNFSASFAMNPQNPGVIL